MKKSSPSSLRRNRGVIVPIVIAVLLVSGYLGYTFVTQSGLFSKNEQSSSSQNQTNVLDPIVIKSISQKDDTLSIELTKNSKEDGYCVLTLQSQRSQLIIDDSKNQNDKLVDCTGWSIGAKDFIKGNYTATVKFVTPKNGYTTAKDFELK
jgi:hypothetical protein